MKRLTVTILALLTVFLAACSNHQTDKATEKVTPLEIETQLPADGVIKKEQMATIVGKKATYRFTGEQEQIRYTWFYPGQQVQNPVTQHLRVTFTDKNLEDIKKQANNAQEALQLHIEKMELAGTPQLAITLPTKWSVDQAFLVREIKGKLKQVKGSEVSLEQGKTTTLKFRVLESDVDYYLVAGNSQKEASSSESQSSGAPTTATSESATTETENPAAPDEATTADSATGTLATTELAGDKDAAEQEAAGNPPVTNNQSQAVPGEKSESKGNSEADKETTPNKEATVTFSISAKTILNNWDQLKKEKQPFVPKDGWILAPTKVSLKAGDSVYDLLVRATRDAGIQMEASWTPMYDAYYIEGINQLYEFDCGGLSGWMFQVNGWFPNYGTSKYTDLHDGDVIQMAYTCDLGHDLGVN